MLGSCHRKTFLRVKFYLVTTLNEARVCALLLRFLAIITESLLLHTVVRMLCRFSLSGNPLLLCFVRLCAQWKKILICACLYQPRPVFRCKPTMTEVAWFHTFLAAKIIFFAASTLLYPFDVSIRQRMSRYVFKSSLLGPCGFHIGGHGRWCRQADIIRSIKFSGAVIYHFIQ